MMRRRDIGRCLAATLAIALSWSASSRAVAQVPAPAPHPVSLRVLDSAGVAIEGADVSVVQGINDVRAAGTTDVRGRLSLNVQGPEGDYQVVVRKIGFYRADQFFRVGTAPVTLDVRMQRAVQTLAPVKVTETENLKRKSYFIDADEIAKHADELIDATDILKKLKPDMICGRSCSPLGAVAATTQTPARKCPGLAFSQRRVCPTDNTPPSLSTNVWVNGVWIRSIATDTVCQIGRRGLLAGLEPGSMQVLCEIQPEHIEQITYADEFDNSVGKPHSNSAIFVVLKTGVGYQPGAKSYVVADTMTSKRTPVAPRTAVVDSSNAAPDSTARKLPSYRYRLLGVFDEETGDPIQGARVIDSSTGTYMNTSVTGTVSLLYLPEGSSLVRITKDGYGDLTLSVVIGPGAAEPLTLTMKKKQ